MTIKSAAAELLKPAGDKIETVEKSFIGSSRFLLVIGFGLFVYLAKSVFTFELFVLLAALAGLYVVCNTVTRIFEIKVEGQIRSERQRLAWTDGVLTAEEVEVMKAADEIAAGRPAVIKPPTA